MKQRLKRYARRVLNVFPSSPNPELEARVSQLEHELDEYRRDSLRVAEMLDLIEQQFTPGAKKEDD
ncbi:MAG: DUF6752 domain-containing protein [Leucobacter sp.]